MSYKIFVISHPKARSPLTIRGHTLREALEREGLDPTLWRPIGKPQVVKDNTDGKNQGDGREESN